MIESKRLILNHCQKNEIEEIIEIENHPENRDFIWQDSYDEHLKHIYNPNAHLLTIKTKDENELVGYILSALDFKSEVYELRRIAITQKRKGYAREVMEAIFKYVFEERKMNRLWLDVYHDHKVGIKFYESLDMHLDGILRQNYKAERGFLDQLVYSVLAEEYFKNKK